MKTKKKTNQEVLESIKKGLRYRGCVDDEELAYFPEKFEFTHEDFMNLFYALDTFASEKGDLDDTSPFYATKKDPKKEYSGIFPEWKVSFQWSEFKFIWRLLIGQGSACQICATEKEGDYKFDEANKIEIDFDNKGKVIKKK